MLRALEANGSKPPEFKTDDDRSYFSVTFFVHEAFLAAARRSEATGGKQAKARKRRSRAELEAAVLVELGKEPASQRELASRLGYSSPSKTLREVVERLIAKGAVEYDGAIGGSQTKLRIRQG